MKLNKKKIVLCGVLCAGITAGSIGHISAHAENMEDNQNPIHENQASGEITPGIIIQILDSKTKQGVEGVRFVITNPTKSEKVGYISTDKNGYASIGLKDGNYLLRQVDTPEGYEKSELFLPFDVDETTKANWYVFTVDKVSDHKQPEAEKEEISKEETQQPGKVDEEDSKDQESSNQPEMDKVEDEVKDQENVEKDQETSQDTDSSKVEESEKGDETVSEEIKQPEAEKDTSEEITSKVEDEKHIETKEEGTEINKDSEPTKVEETVEQQEDVSKDVHVKQEVKKETQPVKQEQKKVRESVQTSDQTTTTTLWLVAGSSLLAMLYACKRKFGKIKK